MGIILNIRQPELKSGTGCENMFSDNSGDEQADDSSSARSVQSEFCDDSDEEAPKRRRTRDYKKRAHRGTTKRTLKFQGSLVCQWALQKLYGIGDSLAQTLRHGGSTYRRGDRRQPKHPELGFSMLVSACHRWPSVLMFFWFLYHTTAEGLPEAAVSMERLADVSKLESSAEGSSLHLNELSVRLRACHTVAPRANSVSNRFECTNSSTYGTHVCVPLVALCASRARTFATCVHYADVHEGIPSVMH
jgi:hypothetical protein